MIKVLRIAYMVSMPFICRKLVGIVLMREATKKELMLNFLPPQEQLAFKVKFPGEADFQAILSEPLQIIVGALQAQATWDDMVRNLPDIALESAKNCGLVTDSEYSLAS